MNFFHRNQKKLFFKILPAIMKISRICFLLFKNILYLPALQRNLSCTVHHRFFELHFRSQVHELKEGLSNWSSQLDERLYRL